MGGGKGGGSQTIGYHYLFDILFGLGRGPINQLVEIKVADKTAWSGAAMDNTVFGISKPSLFGGEKKEGGIQGPFRLFMGRHDQVLPGSGSANCGKSGPYSGSRTLPNVKTAIGGLISEFRGTTMLWYSGLISSMNPYPKEWSFRVRRHSKGWFNDDPWYAVMAKVELASGTIEAMNPAHIIYECFTNPEWGRGLPAAMIDENSFVYAANKLCQEGFGLCMAWQRKEEIDQFVNLVLEHIAGGYYTDPETGKIVLKLVRSDYSEADLPLFTPTSGLLDITDEDDASQSEAFNEIIGTGRDPITNEDFNVRVHNLASRHSQSGFNTLDKDFSGIPTKDLLARVLQRELRIHASGLKKKTVVLDRRGWKIRPGMVFKIQDARRGIGGMVLRAGEITEQSFRDGKITIKAVQDVYSLPTISYVTPTDSTWVPPPTQAVAPAAERLVEPNYRDMVRKLGVTVMNTLDPTDAYIGALALAPNAVMYEYVLATRAAGEPDFSDDAIGPFTGAATLTDAIGPYDTTFEITGETDFTEDLIGQAILVDEEQMGVVDYDDVTHILTVERGVSDTIPAAHLAAATVWTIDDDLVSDARTYAAGETVEAYVLTKTSSDVLDPADTDMLSLELTGRQGRPYPPANVEVDGDLALELPLPHVEHDEPEITWVHRDRLLQEDQLVGHTEASVGPEAGTTYTIRVYDKDAPTVAIRTVAAIAGTTWTYLNVDQATDGNPKGVYIELESVRDGLASHQRYRFFVGLQSGYGLDYGYNYGGATI
jgi:hypothetical protein